MSKLFENKQQLVHIVSEVVVLLGITFYFSQQNKKLMGHIEDLAQQVEEQNDIIIAQEKMLKSHDASIKSIENMLTRNFQPSFNVQSQPVNQPTHQQFFDTDNTKTTKPKNKKSVSFKDDHEEIPITYSSNTQRNTSPPPSTPTIISPIPAFFSMMNAPNFSKPTSSSTVEELEEEPINEEELDAELEEELKDLSDHNEEDDLNKQ